MGVLSQFRDSNILDGQLSGHDRQLLGYTTAAHTLDHAVMLSIPLFVPLWIQQFNVTRAQVGLTVTVMAALFGVTAIPSGVLSDRLGADTLISVFLATTGIALLLVRFIHGFLGLTVALALVGAAAGLYHPPALSLISRDADNPTRGFAYHGLGANIGIGLGPLAMTVGLAFAGWRTILPVFALPLLAFAAIFYVYGPTDHPGDEAYATNRDFRAELSSFVRPAFALLVLMYVGAGLYYRGILTFLPDFLNTIATLPALSIAGVSFGAGRWVYSAILLVGAVGQVAGGHLGERYGPGRVLLGVFAATGAVLFALSILGGLSVLTVGFLFGVLLFTLPPLQSALVSQYVPAASQGLGYGIVFAINFGIGSLGAALAGVVIQTWSFSVLFRSFAVFPVVALAAVFALTRLPSRSPE